MPGRDEALERARLARLRQQLTAEPTDNTLFRGFADEGLRGPLFNATRGSGRSTLPPEERERAEQAVSALGTGALSVPLGFVAGEAARALVPQAGLSDQEQERVLQRRFPGLDPSVQSGGKLRERAVAFGSRRDGLLPSSLAHDYPAPWRAATEFENARQMDQYLARESPLPQVNWQRSARALGAGLSDRVASVTRVPEPGPDLGGFARNWSGPQDGNQVAYTVVPNANSSRFASRLLPAVIDKVYGQDARYSEWVESDGTVERDVVLRRREPGARPVPRDRLGELSPGQRVDLLEQMSPGQTQGRNQSGYLWGTLTEMPRYDYGGSGLSSNPEVVVSEVRTPPELETKYLFTPDTHDPAVRYKQTPDWKAVGPAWGATSLPAAGSVLAGRRKRDVSGDISFRGDLIERRGGLSLADAQAVQSQLGLPVTFGRPDLPAAQALEQAVESIRKAENLPSHGAVVEKYARALPKLGSTTAPRQPAVGRMSEMPLDTQLGITSKLQQAFDVPGALDELGYAPTRAGLKQANLDIAAAAAQRSNRLTGVIRLGPTAGTAMALADPEAAQLVGAALRESGPVQTGLLRDAARVYGQNAVVGAVQGGLMSGVLAAAPRLGLGALATSAATGLGVAAPVLAGTAAVQAADGYLRGATGEGLQQHWRRVQDKASPRGSSAIEQLLPQARSVPARTSSGAAQLKPFRPASNPVEALARKAGQRLNQARAAFSPQRGDFGLTELLLGR